MMFGTAQRPIYDKEVTPHLRHSSHSSRRPPSLMGLPIGLRGRVFPAAGRRSNLVTLAIELHPLVAIGREGIDPHEVVGGAGRIVGIIAHRGFPVVVSEEISLTGAAQLSRMSAQQAIALEIVVQ